MKGRDSGMPDENFWSTFFNPTGIVNALIGKINEDIAEFGSGYGTFTIPAASLTSGKIYAFDIENEMIKMLQQKASLNSIKNIYPLAKDIHIEGTGLQSSIMGHVMIYNLLHIEKPIILLNEARRVLKTGGTISIIHWRSDIQTPRGPSYDIRPTPEKCTDWLVHAGFIKISNVDISQFAQYHFALTAQKEY